MLIDHDSPDTTKWYALYTRSRHENVVRQQLCQKGIEVFLPTFRSLRQWKDRRKKVERPLFPGYCFARFTTGHSLPVLRCSGVLGIVSFNGRLAPVAEWEVNDLQRLVSTNLVYDPYPLLDEGMIVEVIGGPLKGMVGRLLRKNPTRASVVLTIELINQAVRVEVETADVSPIVTARSRLQECWGAATYRDDRRICGC